MKASFYTLATLMALIASQAALAIGETPPPTGLPEPSLWALMTAGGLAYGISKLRNRKK